LKEKLTIAARKNRTHSIAEPGKKGWLWYACAAAVLFLLVSVYVLMDTTKSSQELHLTYFDVTDVTSLINRAGSNNKDLARAQQLFEEQDYESALIIFNENFERSRNSNASLHLYKGIAEMELEQYEDAMHTFQSLTETGLLDAPKGY